MIDRFRGKRREVVFIFFSVLIFSAVSLPCALFASMSRAEGVLYISQVQVTGGEGKTAEDFVELYNPGTEPFNLNGYRLVKRTANGTSDSTLKSWDEDVFVRSKGFYVWANSNFTSIVANAQTSATIADDNGVGLRFGEEDTGALIDSLAWGAADNVFTNVTSENPGAGQAIVRDISNGETPVFLIATSNPRAAVSDAETVEEASPPPPPPSQENESHQAEAVPPPSPVPEISITEILPNPVGDDSGSEKVELKNTSAFEAVLVDWFLGDSSTGPASSNLLKFSATIPAGGYFVIVLPQGSFALNNSGTETVTLYRPDKSVASAVSYSGTSPEGESYQFTQGSWYWIAPTFGQENASPPPPPPPPASASSQEPTTAAVPKTVPPLVTTVKINELLPDPEGADEDGEWIELFNDGTEKVNLDGWKIYFGTRSRVLKGLEISGGGYLVLPTESLPGYLRNSGQDVLLKDSVDRVVDKLSYPESEEGWSYAWAPEARYAWTLALTPGAQNEIVLEEVGGLADEDEKSEPASVKKKTTANTASLSKSSVKAIAGLEDKIASLEQSIIILTSELQQAKLSVKKVEAQEPLKEYAASSSSKGRRYLLFSGGALVLLGFVAWKGLRKPPENG